MIPGGSQAAIPVGKTLPDQAVEIESLTKVYAPRGKMPAKTALSEVSLSVRRGEFFGLLGPNGAGKSTLINVLAGLAVKTGGQVRIWGIDIDRDPRQARGAIGVVPQELNMDPFFTPRELLELQAGLYGVPKPERRTADILAAVGLADRAEAYARTLSGGMRRRLLVAKAMVHNPPVLVLDEPTAGVDLELRHQLWAYVRALNASGTTVMLTTHYLPEAEELCDRIAIIDRGRLIACDTTPALLARLDRKVLCIVVDRDLAAIPDPLLPYPVELDAPRRLIFRYPPSKTPIGALLDAVARADLRIVDLTTEETDLEDIFLKLTGGHRRPEEAG